MNIKKKSSNISKNANHGVRKVLVDLRIRKVYLTTYRANFQSQKKLLILSLKQQFFLTESPIHQFSCIEFPQKNETLRVVFEIPCSPIGKV